MPIGNHVRYSLRQIRVGFMFTMDLATILISGENDALALRIGWGQDTFVKHNSHGMACKSLERGIVFC